MKQNKILSTKNLILREFALEDASFIVSLLNTPNWLKYIGDRNVHTNEDAKKFLINGPISSYKKHGFGFWLTELKRCNTPVGMCGLIKRETLKDIDIGFAFLPEYTKQGYGYEAAQATLDYAKNCLSIPRIVAITNPDNIASIKLLNKLGLSFEKALDLPEYESTHLFS